MSELIKNAMPCPFCGGIDIRLYKIDLKRKVAYFNAFCHDCGAEVKYGDTKEDIIKIWNRKKNMGKSDKLTIFDYFKNICKKSGLIEKEEVQKSFDVIGINRLMSYDRQNILLANEVNSFGFDKWSIYLYYYYGCDERQRVPFLNMKKIKDEERERVEEIAGILFPQYSKARISEDVMPILKNELTKFNLEELTNHGGVQKHDTA